MESIPGNGFSPYQPARTQYSWFQISLDVDRLPDDPPFDILLTDMLLPDVEGGALALKLRTRWPHMAVVLMSGYEGDAVRHSTELGAEFLQKPFDTPVLASMLRRALATQNGTLLSS